jgi:hypothetical protein
MFRIIDRHPFLPLREPSWFALLAKVFQKSQTGTRAHQNMKLASQKFSRIARYKALREWA